jgi:hypothetical protein
MQDAVSFRDTERRILVDNGFSKSSLAADSREIKREIERDKIGI